jgi:hypothetical protein
MDGGWETISRSTASDMLLSDLLGRYGQRIVGIGTNGQILLATWVG